MFKKLKQWIGGSLSFDELIDRLDYWIRTAGRGRSSATDLAIQDLRANRAWLDDWRESQLEILERVAATSSKRGQVIALRRETLAQIEIAAHASAVLADGRSDEDQQVLRDRIFPHRTVGEALYECYHGYVFATARIRSLRAISRELGDARDNDWFDYLSELHRQLADFSVEAMLADAKGQTYVAGGSVKDLRRTIDDASAGVLAGRNWHFEMPETEQESTVADPYDQAPQSGQKPGITDGQLIALSDILTERMQRIREGGLYRFDGKAPIVPEQVFMVDTALMLIAIDECVADSDVALSGIRDVISTTMNDLQPNALPPEDVNLDVQLEFLAMWQEKGEEPPISRFCFAAAHLLYDIDPIDGNEERDRIAAAIGAALYDDTWSLLAATKSVFGHRPE